MNTSEPTTGTGPWSVAEDRPAYLENAPRRRRRVENAPSSQRWALAAVLALLVAAVVAFFGVDRRDDARPPEASSPAPAPPAASHPGTPAPFADAAPRYELKPRAEEPLPVLENSDPMIGKSISGLVGKKAFDRFVIPEMIVRHIVATVDNLPRPTGSTRTVPLHKAPGTLSVTGAGGDLRMDASNSRRYEAYVRVFASIEAHALAQRYAATYPLFQQAYEELGYPGGHFNERLIAAIDDLLAAPELDAPAKIVQSPVIYKFADPDLEARSAGQKIMMRMGKENAVAVKAKLREIRREIVALAQH
jgi:hypothetical protein